MASRRRARIIGTGSYLPKKELTNSDLEKMVDTTHDWIVSRTGICSRRIAEKDEFPSTMGSIAAQAALKNAHLTPKEIDLILVATMSGDYPSPSTAALIQHSIGAEKAAAMDIQAACSGFVYALSTAKAYIEAEMAKNILVIAAEKMSSIVDFTDRSTCVLFGDGAAAAVVSSEGKGLLVGPISMGTDGSLSDLVIIPGGGARHPTTTDTVAQGLHYFKMSGTELFKHAVRQAISVAETCLERASISAEDLRWVVPHQANHRMMSAIAKGLKLPQQKIFSVVEKYGNTSAAGIGIALSELMTHHPLAAGENILLDAFGGGLTWAAALLTQDKTS